MANIFLVILKVWTVLLSDSLAVLASMIDSLMDLLSGAIIWYSARLRSNTTDGHRYPVGKARMEPLGIIVFASVMVTSFMQVMLQAFERLLAGSEEPPVDLGVIILILLALNILVKTALWLWCRTMIDSASVLALAQDHLNDVVFNVFSTLFPVAGQFLGLWWLDATGAILLSIYIISEWTGTCLRECCDSVIFGLLRVPQNAYSYMFIYILFGIDENIFRQYSSTDRTGSVVGGHPAADVHGLSVLKQNSSDRHGTRLLRGRGPLC